MLKIAFFDAKPYDKISFEKYASIHGIRIKYYETRLNEDTVELAKNYDGVCAFVNDDVSSVVLESLCRYGVKFVVMRCAGYNNVDLKSAKGKIRVARVPAYSPYAIAEHAMAMLLCSVRKIHKAFIRTKDFNFSLDGLTGFDLHGKTVGVVGTGKIGQAFISICKGFSMNILAYDKICNTDVTYVKLDEILSRSDIISLHCPLTEETYHMIDKNAIAKMKRFLHVAGAAAVAVVVLCLLLVPFAKTQSKSYAGTKETKITFGDLAQQEEYSVDNLKTFRVLLWIAVAGTGALVAKGYLDREKGGMPHKYYLLSGGVLFVVIIMVMIAHLNAETEIFYGKSTMSMWWFLPMVVDVLYLGLVGAIVAFKKIMAQAEAGLVAANATQAQKTTEE